MDKLEWHNLFERNKQVSLLVLKICNISKLIRNLCYGIMSIIVGPDPKQLRPVRISVIGSVFLLGSFLRWEMITRWLLFYGAEVAKSHIDFCSFHLFASYSISIIPENNVR